MEVVAFVPKRAADQTQNQDGQAHRFLQQVEPVRLSLQEINALKSGVKAVALLGNQGDAVAARSAQAKLNAMMPDVLAGHVDQALVHARKAGRALGQR